MSAENFNSQNTPQSPKQENSNNGTNNSKKNKKRYVPIAENELLAVAKIVAKQWDEDVLKLNWISKQEFVDTVNEFETQITNIEKYHKDRKKIVFGLSELDDEINLKISRLKHIVLASFPKNQAKNIISQLGISGKLNRKNREYRVILLQTLPDKLSDTEIELIEDLNAQYWQTVYEKYSIMLEELKGIVSVDSEYISNKNANKEKIRKTLNCLIYAVKANFPETWQSELRQLGLQKEYY